MTIPFASFVVAAVRENLYAATTRDNFEKEKFGLPGGKLEPGETPERAVIREAAEEGWDIIGPLKLIHKYINRDNKEIWWYSAARAIRKDYFKEKGRIVPVELSLEEISVSGFGNSFLKDYKPSLW